MAPNSFAAAVDLGPKTDTGKGDAVIQLTADGIAANPVHVTVK